jgi:hemolysin III
VSPTPIWPIRLLDKAAETSVQKHRAGDAAAAERAATKGERIAISVTNVLGLSASVVAFALLVVSASLYGDAWHVVSFSVFGFTLFLLYAITALYYASNSEKGKAFFLKLGRACAFLLIAGTYTPFLLVSLRGPWGWVLFGLVWGLCAAGMIFQFVVGNRYRVTSTLATLFVGWMVVVAIKPLVAVIPHGGLWLLLAGGLCYSLSAVLASIRSLRYRVAATNAFVLGGSICHLLAVMLFVLPQHA